MNGRPCSGLMLQASGRTIRVIAIATNTEDKDIKLSPHHEQFEKKDKHFNFAVWHRRLFLVCWAGAREAPKALSLIGTHLLLSLHWTLLMVHVILASSRRPHLGCLRRMLPQH